MEIVKNETEMSVTEIQAEVINIISKVGFNFFGGERHFVAYIEPGANNGGRFIESHGEVVLGHTPVVVIIDIQGR